MESAPFQFQVKNKTFFYSVIILFFLFFSVAGFLFWRFQTVKKEEKQEQIEEKKTSNLELVSPEGLLNSFPLNVGLTSELYYLSAIIDDEVQLDPELELPDGKKVTTLMRCYYYDAQGNLQKINIPLYVYDPQEFTIYKITRGIWKRNSVEELNDTVEENKDGVDLNMGPMVIEGIPDLESGDIAYIGFNMEANPSLDSRDRDFFQDAVSLFHTQASLDAFAQTGDPNNLPMVSELQEPLLIPLKARKIGLSPEALRDIMEEDESN